MVIDLLNQLGVDRTLWVQLVVFVVFYAWIRFVLFPPFVRLLERRESQTSGLSSEVETLNKQAEEKEAELAQRLSEVRREAANEREKSIGEAKAVSHEQVDRARRAAKERIEEARARVEQEQAAELVNLKQQAQELSDLLVNKLTKEGARV